MKMSFKALFLGAFVTLVISLLLSILKGYLFVQIYSDINSPGIVDNVLFHPLSILMFALSLIFSFSFPAYLTTVIAKEAYYRHGLVVCVFGCFLTLLDFDAVQANPVYFVFVICCSIIFSILGVKIRIIQKTNKLAKNN